MAQVCYQTRKGAGRIREMHDAEAILRTLRRCKGEASVRDASGQRIGGVDWDAERSDWNWWLDRGAVR